MLGHFHSEAGPVVLEDAAGRDTVTVESTPFHFILYLF